jgi:hypothetical protein
MPHRAPGHQLPSSRFQHRRAASARKAATCSAVGRAQPHDRDVPSVSAATATWRTVPQEHRQPARRPVASRPRTSQLPNCCPMVTGGAATWAPRTYPDHRPSFALRQDRDADVCENNELRTYSISPSVTGLEGREGSHLALRRRAGSLRRRARAATSRRLSSTGT